MLALGNAFLFQHSPEQQYQKQQQLHSHGCCKFRFPCEWLNKQQFLRSSPPQLGMWAPVQTGHIMLSFKLSVNTHLGGEDSCFLYIPVRNSLGTRRSCVSMTASAVHYAPANFINAQLHFSGQFNMLF